MLHDSLDALTSADFQANLADTTEHPSVTHSFNLGLLVFLGKAPTGVQEDVGTYYSADATRPLSIVNTDNRLLASAARLAWEPLLAPLISDDQQGFLQGRSMIRNLVELDYFSMLSSLTSENGAAVLFDFRAAFPSASPLLTGTAAPCLFSVRGRAV